MSRHIPKSARKPHKRKAPTSDRTQNHNGYRIEASWNDRPNKPAITTTPDRKKARRLARQWAEQGAYVIVQEHAGWHVWRTIDEVDGPALLAERAAAEQAAVEDARRTARDAEQRLAAARRTALLDAEYAAQTAQNQRARAAAEEAEHDRLARLMVRPPVARDATGRPTARHTAGGRR
jgi:hypothetical protein